MNIKLRIDQTDVRKTVTLRQLLKAQSGDINTIVDLLSRFVVGEDGQLLPPEKGKDIVLDLTIDELEQASKSLYGAAMDAAVPPESAAS